MAHSKDAGVVTSRLRRSTRTREDEVEEAAAEAAAEAEDEEEVAE